MHDFDGMRVVAVLGGVDQLDVEIACVPGDNVACSSRLRRTAAAHALPGSSSPQKMVELDGEDGGKSACEDYRKDTHGSSIMCAPPALQ
jgi:hypothetical protein